MITKDDINKALNVLSYLEVNYGNRNADEIKELDNALDIIQMAAQAYANIGADYYSDRQQKKNNNSYVTGYSQAREDVERLIAGQGVLILQTDTELKAVDAFHIIPKKGNPVKYIKAEGQENEK